MLGIDNSDWQALVKRTNKLKKENESLRQSMAQLQTSFNEQQKLIAQSLKQMEALTIKQNIKEPVAKN